MLSCASLCQACSVPGALEQSLFSQAKLQAEFRSVLSPAFRVSLVAAAYRSCWLPTERLCTATSKIGRAVRQGPRCYALQRQDPTKPLLLGSPIVELGPWRCPASGAASCTLRRLTSLSLVGTKWLSTDYADLAQATTTDLNRIQGGPVLAKGWNNSENCLELSLPVHRAQPQGGEPFSYSKVGKGTEGLLAPFPFSFSFSFSFPYAVAH